MLLQQLQVPPKPSGLVMLCDARLYVAWCLRGMRGAANPARALLQPPNHAVEDMLWHKYSENGWVLVTLMYSRELDLFLSIMGIKL